jgi:hypothetical protein
MTPPRRIKLTKALQVPDGTSIRRFDAGSFVSEPSPELLAYADGHYIDVLPKVVEAREKLPKEKA